MPVIIIATRFISINCLWPAFECSLRRVPFGRFRVSAAPAPAMIRHTCFFTRRLQVINVHLIIEK